MNYQLDCLIRDISENSELLIELKEKPDEICKQYGVKLEEIETINNQDLVSLYHKGAHPLSVMLLGGVFKIDPTDYFTQIRGR